MQRIKLIAIVFTFVILIGSVLAFADDIDYVHNYDFFYDYTNQPLAGLLITYKKAYTPKARTIGPADQNDRLHVCKTTIISANNTAHYSTSYAVNGITMDSGYCYGESNRDVLSITHYLFREKSDETEWMHRVIVSYN